VFADSLFFDEGFLDDPLGIDLTGKLPWRTCEMPGLREARAYFRLAVAGDLREPDGSVMYFDDAGYFDDPAWGFPDVGMHPQLVSALRSIQESARVKVAGGVQFDTYVECVQRLDMLEDIPAFGISNLSSPPGVAWLLRDGLVTITKGGEPASPTTAVYMLTLVLTDGSTLSTAVSSAKDGMSLRTFELERLGYRSQLVAQIIVTAATSGPVPVRVVGTFWVTPVTL
jgi:hypothetical protein